MNKPLTPAQQRKLGNLISQMNALRFEMDQFIGYLRDEHEAPEEEWDLNDINEGFVMKVEEQQEEIVSQLPSDAQPVNNGPRQMIPQQG